MRQPRSMKELLDDPRVDTIHTNEGYWVYLQYGLIEPELGITYIHEYTLRDVFDKLWGVRPLTPADQHFDEATAEEITEAQAICDLFRKR